MPWSVPPHCFCSCLKCLPTPVWNGALKYRFLPACRNQEGNLSVWCWQGWGEKWQLTFTSVLGSNRAWWGQWSSGGQVPWPKHDSSWPSLPYKNVPSWTQCYQASLFLERMQSPFLCFESPDFINDSNCLKLKASLGLTCTHCYI